MQEATLQQLITKYLQGKATPAETQQVEQWFLDMGDAAHLDLGPQTRSAQRQLRERIYEKIQDNIAIVPATPVLRRSPWRWHAAAASVALLITAAWWWQRPSSKPAVVADRNLFTQKGQLSQVVLPDSTLVWLNANSHLRFPTSFDGSRREVYLEGEAYFDVHPDPQHPFIIESGAYRTRVLGTAFSIRAYTASHLFQVTVSSGKVGVYNPLDSNAVIYLTANEQLNSDKNTLQPQVRHLAAGDYLAWKTGGLHFEKERLEDVAQALENRYSKHFIITNTTLASLPVSGTFDKQDRLENVLKILARVYHLQFSNNANGDIAIH